MPGEELDRLQVFFSNDNVHFLDDKEVVRVEEMAMPALIDRVFNSTNSLRRCYYRQPLSEARFPSLLLLTPFQLPCLQPLLHFPTPLVFGPPETRHRFKRQFSAHLAMLWIGHGGNITPLHYDRCHGFLCQLKVLLLPSSPPHPHPPAHPSSASTPSTASSQGTKRLWLFRPKDTRLLYQREPQTQKAHTSTLRVEALMGEDKEFASPPPLLQAHLTPLREQARELALCPKAAGAKPYLCDLNPGEALYIPPGPSFPPLFLRLIIPNRLLALRHIHEQLHLCDARLGH